jgi:molybdopterin synthase catalytic subunit
MIQLTESRIDPASALDQVHSTRAGAAVLFVGTTRQMTDGRQTESLDYVCYPKMAEKKLAELETEARRRWPLVGCAILHRLGHLMPGEISIAVAVSSPHRHDAFQAGQWLIDTIKQVVPIWKQENWTDGTRQWVHPGIEPFAEQPVTE